MLPDAGDHYFGWKIWYF